MRPVPTVPVALVLVLILGLGTTACGGRSYCDTLKADRSEFAAMNDADSPVALLDHRTMLHDLAEKAPNDLSDEWHTFLAAVDALHEALAKAGVNPADFASGKPPTGLSASDRQAIAEAADGLSQPDTVAASQGIDQQARDVCKVNLGS